MGSNPYSIRLAEAQDAAAIAALIESAYRGDESRRGWTTEAHLIEGNRTSVAEIAEFISAPEKRFVIALKGQQTVGCALISNENGAGYFGMFAVRPDIQGGGLGKQILEFAEQKLREIWRCSQVTMTVISIRHELIAFYERRGYKQTSSKPFPFDQEPGAKRTDFHFVVLSKSFD